MSDKDFPTDQRGLEVSAKKFLVCRLSSLMFAVLLVSCDGSHHPSVQETRILNFYNWASYIDPTVFADFEKETGIKVRLAIYPS